MSFQPENFNIWFELPVTDLEKAVSFYNTVFRTELTVVPEAGQNPIAMFPVKEGGRAGHLYPGKPPARGSGPTVHLPVPDTIEATAKRLKEAGGEVVSGLVSIPAGNFTYCLDPDGNSISLFSK
ncbi:VOC family protein [Roseibium sp. RKSG952]|nr:VOC family protein [Roseibium sp. RKSG952]